MVLNGDSKIESWNSNLLSDPTSEPMASEERLALGDRPYSFQCAFAKIDETAEVPLPLRNYLNTMDAIFAVSRTINDLKDL